MQQQSGDTFGGIDEARRVLGDVFADWVKDLNLSIEGIDYDPPTDAPADPARYSRRWGPGALAYSLASASE